MSCPIITQEPRGQFALSFDEGTPEHQGNVLIVSFCNSKFTFTGKLLAKLSLVFKLVESLNHWIIGSLNHWIIESLNHWINESLNHSTIELLNHWTIESLNYWTIEPLNHWTIESFNHWTTESMNHPIIEYFILYF